MNGAKHSSAIEQDEQRRGDDVEFEPSVIDGLISRAKTLLSELELFHERLRGLRREGQIEIAHFRSTIQSELSMLQRLSDKPDDDATKHVARSSNMPFLETIWSTAKCSKDVVSLQKRIYTQPGVKSTSQGMRHIASKGSKIDIKGLKRNAVAVDAITDSGKVWTKVSHVTNQRILFDLAKQGWVSGGSDSDNDEANDSRPDDDDDVPLLKTAKELSAAAKCFRVRTRSPKVHLILPRIEYGEVPEVDAIVDACRAAGATLFLSSHVQAVPTIDAAFRRMAPDSVDSFSEVLNIDCTVLLAMVSEFSHAKVSKEPWFHKALMRQVEIEDNENLLPSLLYPAMGSHELVCTEEAVKRMREIVQTIGTPSEKARTAIMLGDDSSKSRDELLDEMQEWSAYHVPRDWQLPIRTVDQNENSCQASLPPEAHQVAKGMTSINRSVFLYGWATGRTTVSSNRTVVKQIETDLEGFVDLDEEAIWPRIWVCPTARSLVGKEKRGAKKPADGGKEAHTAWPLPDPLRREQQRRNGLDVLAQRQGHEVEDLRPEGYNYEEVMAAKMASLR